SGRAPRQPNRLTARLTRNRLRGDASRSIDRSAHMLSLARGAIVPALALVAASGVGDTFAQPRDQAPRRILVGPNVRVSRSSNDPRVELMIATNPTNPRNLIGTSIVSGALVETCATYTSLDGGNTWAETSPAGLPEGGAGDPQVAFGADGAAYF